MFSKWNTQYMSHTDKAFIDASILKQLGKKCPYIHVLAGKGMGRISYIQLNITQLIARFFWQSVKADHQNKKSDLDLRQLQKPCHGSITMKICVHIRKVMKHRGDCHIALFALFLPLKVNFMTPKCVRFSLMFYYLFYYGDYSFGMY